MIYQYTS